jgi:hypothetical protein
MWPIKILIFLVIAGCGGSGIEQAQQKAYFANQKPPLEVPAGVQSKPIQFKRIVVKLRRGTAIGSMKAGILCIPRRSLVWRGGRATFSGDELTEVFQGELKQANYSVVGDTTALFNDPSEWKAEHLIAGLVTNMQADLWFPLIGYQDTQTVKGEATMTVQWQLYSRLDRKVVYKTTTVGKYVRGSSIATGASDMFFNAFADATRQLLAEKEFYDILVASKPPASKKPTQLVYIKNMDRG